VGGDTGIRLSSFVVRHFYPACHMKLSATEINIEKFRVKVKMLPIETSHFQRNSTAITLNLFIPLLKKPPRRLIVLMSNIHPRFKNMGNFSFFYPQPLRIAL
jgi:hypothetical protein